MPIPDPKRAWGALKHNWKGGHIFFSPFDVNDPDLPGTIQHNTRNISLLLGATGAITWSLFGLGVISILGTGYTFWKAKQEFSKKVDDLYLNVGLHPLEDRPDFKVTYQTEAGLKFAFNLKLAAGGFLIFPITTMPSFLHNLYEGLLAYNRFSFLMGPMAVLAATSLNLIADKKIADTFHDAGWTPPRPKNLKPPSSPEGGSPT